MEDLNKEISSLQEQSNSLERNIKFEDHPLQKENLINKKADIDNQIFKLRAKQEVYNQKFYDEKTINLIQKDRLFIFFQAGGHIIKIPPDLMVEIVFSCGHKRKMNIKEVLRNYEFHQNKRTPEINLRLFNKWHGLLTSTANITGSLNCLECRKHKEGLRSKFGRWNDKSIGTVSFILRKMQ